MTSTTLTRVSGFLGSFTGELTTSDQTSDIEFGACIIATGAHETRPNEYLYNEDPRVMTLMDFRARVQKNPEYPGSLDSVVFIQCVGSRDENHPYCSRVCCTHSIQNAVRLKKDKPEMDIFILYRDIRTYADKEDLYLEARNLGVIFIRYSRDKKPSVSCLNVHPMPMVFSWKPIPNFGLWIQLWTGSFLQACVTTPNP